MTTTHPSTLSPVDAEHVRDRVDAALSTFLDHQRSRFDSMLPTGDARSSWLDALTSLRDFLGPGKRLRPAFCYWGWRGAGGDPANTGIITAAAALELLHAFALVHDDIIDDSDTRRGAPSLHREHATRHARTARQGCSGQYGRSVALLLGDLCLSWCHEMLDSSGLPDDRLRSARRFLAHNFSELVLGQYLDVHEQVNRTHELERAATVLHYKTAKYTVERPMHLGGALAGAPPELLDSYTDYAVPLGEAFQLRDDVLGAFGETEVTGKPVADDLRARKSTVLLATARQRATPEQFEQFEGLLAEPDLTDTEVEHLSSLLIRTGALRESEDCISLRTQASERALAAMPVDDDVRSALHHLVIASTQREC